MELVGQNMRHVLSTGQFKDRDFLKRLFSIAKDMEQKDKENSIQMTLAGKILACLFYEPSTRTRFSFESAMHKLGGKVITTENAAQFSSSIKGETLEDSIKILGGYADAIVLRHPEKGAAKKAAGHSLVPIINAGDGSGEHPTQALLDLYTIESELGAIDGKNVVLVGDLLYGRTIHSLIQLLPFFKDVIVTFVSPEQLRIPDEYKRFLSENGIEFKESTDLRKSAEEADLIYMTRIQKERFPSLVKYEEVKDAYVLDESILHSMKEEAIVMHPLPRVNEISTSVDSDKRAAYFRQAKNGLYIRMALLEHVFGFR